MSLDLILEKTGFSPRSVKLLKACHQLFLNIIKEYDNKGIVLSTGDADDYIDLFMEKNKLDEPDEVTDYYFNKIDLILVEKGLVYKSEDKESYLNKVRNQGKISKREHDMGEELAQNPGIIFRDTEFPIDSNGKYII